LTALRNLESVIHRPLNPTPENSCHKRNLCEHGEDGGTGKGEERGTEDVGTRLEWWRSWDNGNGGVLRRNGGSGAGRRAGLSTRADWLRSGRRRARVVILAGWRSGRAALVTGADWGWRRRRDSSLSGARDGAVSVGGSWHRSDNVDVAGSGTRASRDLRRAGGDGHDLGRVDSGIGRVGGSDGSTDEGGDGDGGELHFDYVVGLRVVR